MNSKTDLDKVMINDDTHGILVEGDLGDLSEISLIEEKLLEIKFTKGVFRLDINRLELLQATEKNILVNEKGDKK